MKINKNVAFAMNAGADSFQGITSAYKSTI
jgi:hypothetical protein